MLIFTRLCNVESVIYIHVSRTGRVDVVVQSTDKNFMVPVGGSVVFTFDNVTAKRISAAYPGQFLNYPRHFIDTEAFQAKGISC